MKNLGSCDNNVNVLRYTQPCTSLPLDHFNSNMNGGSCDKNVDVSQYDNACTSLPLDYRYQNYKMNGGGYFLDVGNPNPITDGFSPVQGYSECCPPVFNTSSTTGTNEFNANNTNSNLANTNTTGSSLFNDSGWLVGKAGNPICGGGKRNKDGVRVTKSTKAKDKASRNMYTGKQTRRRLQQLSMTQNSKKSNKNNSKKGNNKKTKGKKKKQKGGELSVYHGNMVNRTFGCRQPTWSSSCI